MSKLTTLSQLKSSLEATKSYIDTQDSVLSGRIDAVVEDIEGIVATGGEANVLEGVKVNGAALDIADKMVDILIAAQHAGQHRAGMGEAAQLPVK